MEKVSLTLQNRELIEEIIEKNPDLQTRIHNSIIDSLSKRLVKSICNTPEVQDRIEREQKKFEENLLKQIMEPTQYGYSYHLKSEYARKLSEFIKDRINEELSSGVAEAIKKECEKKYEEVHDAVARAVDARVEAINKFDAEKYMKEQIDREIKQRLDKVMKG